MKNWEIEHIVKDLERAAGRRSDEDDPAEDPADRAARAARRRRDAEALRELEELASLKQRPEEVGIV